MRKITDDRQENGRWLQRTWIDGKYTWTVSGVLWNNIKERTAVNSVTQKTEPTYVGSENLFKDYQTFVEWSRKQIGYGMGYDLDADLLRDGTKKYSESTGVLIPPALNRFLQGNNSAAKGNKELPTGIQYKAKNKSKIFIAMKVLTDDCKGSRFWSGVQDVSKIEELKEQYLYLKNKQVEKWINYLEVNGLVIDPRVVNSLKRLEFYYENSTRARWRLNSLSL